jgi:hypothetical protein
MITGLVAIVWGVILTNVWLALVGFLVTLVGSVLYGWSLRDDGS